MDVALTGKVWLYNTTTGLPLQRHGACPMEYTQTGVNRALKDIRPRAEERARRRQEEAQRPPGTGFMSERTRAKEALRVEVNTYTGENVRKIAATAAVAEEDRILRVAAYCRVSTDDIDQLVSIEMQKNAYLL